uniref:Uncharacterized protein n=1 Tax=Pleurozia purpurea TaxID=280637 RepID=D0R022_9MARC|nr:hypothetical protein PlpuMp23 [Pleurozia purpurea]ACR19359.1 hypothetical protein PlpuMp23 [Pleurozia purpurea]
MPGGRRGTVRCFRGNEKTDKKRGTVRKKGRKKLTGHETKWRERRRVALPSRRPHKVLRASSPYSRVPLAAIGTECAAGSVFGEREVRSTRPEGERFTIKGRSSTRQGESCTLLKFALVWFVCQL